MSVTAPAALYRLTVPGEPVPKARPRVDPRTMRIYTPATTVKAEHNLGWRFKQAYPGIEPDAVTRFGVRVIFHCHWEGSGDVDNKIKTVLDALQGVVYANDKQVDEIHALIVHRAIQPRTEIEIFRSAWR